MIYTVNKKNYLIFIIFLLTIFLIWCNKNITIINNDTKIEKKSDWNILSKTKMNIDPKEDGIYQNKKEWFSLKLLSWRKIQENIYWSLLLISSPQLIWDNVNEKLWISTDSQSDKKTVEEYYTQQKQGIEKHINNYKEISKEHLKIAKTDWIKIIYQWNLWNNNLQRQQIIFYKNWKFFLITYTATQDTFNEYINQINTIIESLKF
jgi:hypothetical protein